MFVRRMRTEQLQQYFKHTGCGWCDNGGRYKSYQRSCSVQF